MEAVKLYPVVQHFLQTMKDQPIVGFNQDCLNNENNPGGHCQDVMVSRDNDWTVYHIEPRP